MDSLPVIGSGFARSEDVTSESVVEHRPHKEVKWCAITRRFLSHRSEISRTLHPLANRFRFLLPVTREVLGEF